MKKYSADEVIKIIDKAVKNESEVVIIIKDGERLKHFIQIIRGKLK